MSSLWNIDLENGPQARRNSTPLPPDPSSLTEHISLDEIKVPLPSPLPDEELQLLNYGDRLVYNYLAPRPHPRFDNLNYDDTIIQAARFRHLNISRIQHDLLRLQNVLTSAGGGTEENFARLSSLLHEHGAFWTLLFRFEFLPVCSYKLISFAATAIRDWDFISRSTTKLHHNPRYMENLQSQYPELSWDKANAPPRLALLSPAEDKSQNLITSIRSVLPRSWCWSKTERELRPQAYKLDLQGVSGLGPRNPSLTATILSGIILSLATSTLILVPMIIMSFQVGRTKSLVTVAVAVTLFGFVLVVGVRTRSSETFLATATYAAILVVFVSTSNSTTTNN